VTLTGKAMKPGDIPASVAAGVGMAPEERKSQALFMHESVATNITAASMKRYARLGFIDRRRERADAAAQVRALQVRPDDPARPVVTLSGGNQQKVVVGRWLLHGCRLLLLDEPTRGVDVGARAELYALVRQLADSGVGVLLVSSEVPEVLGLADRVLVVREGRIVHEAAAQDIDESTVLDLVMEGSSV
jgi:ribose transport system ATP-binding protein